MGAAVWHDKQSWILRERFRRKYPGREANSAWPCVRRRDGVCLFGCLLAIILVVFGAESTIAQTVEMTPEQAAMWRKIADESSYKAFAEQVKGGRELLDMALSVD